MEVAENVKSKPYWYQQIYYLVHARVPGYSSDWLSNVTVVSDTKELNLLKPESESTVSEDVFNVMCNGLCNGQGCNSNAISWILSLIYCC